MKQSPLKDKSYTFAIGIIKLSSYLQSEYKDYVLSRQILKSGTSIGALLREAEFGQSQADFTSKLSIALKEANETEYWLSLLKDTGYINDDLFQSLQSDRKELIAMLVSSVKTSKHNSIH